MKVINYLLSFLALGFIAWCMFLLNSNQNLKKDLEDIKENYNALEGFNQVLMYDLSTSRDSVRLLRQRNSELMQ